MSRLHPDRRHRAPRAPPNPTFRSTVATTALFVGVLLLATWPLATVAGLILARSAWWAVHRFGWRSLDRRGPATPESTDRTASDVGGRASADPR